MIEIGFTVSTWQKKLFYYFLFGGEKNSANQSENNQIKFWKQEKSYNLVKIIKKIIISSLPDE